MYMWERERWARGTGYLDNSLPVIYGQKMNNRDSLSAFIDPLINEIYLMHIIRIWRFNWKLLKCHDMYCSLMWMAFDWWMTVKDGLKPHDGLLSLCFSISWMEGPLVDDELLIHENESSSSLRSVGMRWSNWLVRIDPDFHYVIGRCYEMDVHLRIEIVIETVVAGKFSWAILLLLVCPMRGLFSF